MTHLLHSACHPHDLTRFARSEFVILQKPKFMKKVELHGLLYCNESRKYTDFVTLRQEESRCALWDIETGHISIPPAGIWSSIRSASLIRQAVNIFHIYERIGSPPRYIRDIAVVLSTMHLSLLPLKLLDSKL
uniref:Uncharacterized protein n=1 Tax=Hyaloperonospora arabidopsidis (strain Emoy2) TaxID=559515 RepID=M4BNC7_HYAAE